VDKGQKLGISHLDIHQYTKILGMIHLRAKCLRTAPDLEIQKEVLRLLKGTGKETTKNALLNWSTLWQRKNSQKGQLCTTLSQRGIEKL
jgi:hypothetical protein